MMKLALLAALFTACTAEAPQAIPTSTEWPKWLTECSTAPQIPQWSYVPTQDGKSVVIPLEQWDRHVAWSIAVAAWSDCVDATRF